MLFICTASLPFSSPRNMPLFREVLSSSTAFPPILSQGDCLSVLSFALPYPFAAVAFRNLHSYGSGSSSVSSILMAGKLSVGTHCRQKLSRAPLVLSCQRPAALPVVPSLLGERAPCASIVRCFPSSEIRRRVPSQLPTNLCPVREAPLSAYTLPLQGGATFYTSYSIPVPERWIRRRCCFLVGN
jgi:hypothetical protein